MTASEEAVEPRDCPYVGLDYYQERFGAWFFGREADGSKIITNLQASRLTLLHADSGVGKSSLLRAGVAWRLRQIARKEPPLGGETDIPVVFSSWKDDPVQELVHAIGTAIEPFLAGRPRPELPAGRLDAAIEAAAGAVNATLLVVLDQFEEYFLYSSGERTPQRFADQLARCINRPDLPANFLISIREDAYASLGDLFKGRIANVYGNYLHIDYLDRASAETAIRAPLDVYNGLPGVTERVGIQDALVEAVLDQVRAAGPDASHVPSPAMNGESRVATPLLQLVMEAVWRRERAEGSHELRASTLQKLEGVKKIVDTHLAKALRGLGKSERQAAIDMFAILVTPSGGKIAVSVYDLARRTGHTDEQTGRVLQKLDHARIVRPVPAPPGQDPVQFRRYEIFHDVLAPAINRTIAARGDQRRMRRNRRLATVAVGVLLAMLAVAIGFAILAQSARVAARNADRQRNIAVSDKLAAESETIVSQEPLLGSLLAVTAWRIYRTHQARASLLNAFAQPDHGVPLVGKVPAEAVAFSPDGKLLVTVSAGYSAKVGSARLWRVATRRPDAALMGTGVVTAVGFDPANGTILATAGWDGYVRLWNSHTLRQIRAFPVGRGAGLTAVAFSPGGKTLAIGGADGTCWLWNLAKHRAIRTFRASRIGPVNAVAFSPDGATLATAGADGTARLWNPATGRQLRVFRVSRISSVNGVAFSPDGRALAAAGGDGTARVWDLATGRQLRSFRASRTGAVNAVAFRPDGKILATAGADGTARVWNLATGKPVYMPFAAGSGAMNAVAFSPDGKTLATAGADGTARLWDVFVYRPFGPALPAGTGAVYAVAFGPQAKTLATADSDGAARVRNLATGQQLSSFQDSGTSPVVVAAFSPDGKTLATWYADGTALLWNTATGQQLRTLQPSRTGAVTAAAFSPDGKTLATGYAFGAALLWNTATGQRAGAPLPAGSGAINAVAFSHNGKTLATAGTDGVVRLWNVRTHVMSGASIPVNLGIRSLAFEPDGKKIATAGNNTIRLWAVPPALGHRPGVLRQIGPPLISGNEAMNAVAFSPDGRTLATASNDGTARLWDVVTHQQIGPPLFARGGVVRDVAFGPGGSTLVTATGGGFVQLWNIALPEDKSLAGAVCAMSGRSLQQQEWAEFVGSGEPFRLVCP